MTHTEREEEKKRLYELIAQSYTSNRSKWEVELFEDYMLQQEIPKLVDDLLDGGVIVPPCKMGDTVYEIGDGCLDPTDDYCDNVCCSCKYHCMTIRDVLIDSLYKSFTIMRYWRKDYFPTRKEAEQALEECKK